MSDYSGDAGVWYTTVELVGLHSIYPSRDKDPRKEPRLWLAITSLLLNRRNSIFGR